MAGLIICEVGIRTITDPTWSNLIIESTDVVTEVGNFGITSKIYPDFRSVVALLDKHHVRLSLYAEI